MAHACNRKRRTKSPGGRGSPAPEQGPHARRGAPGRQARAEAALQRAQLALAKQHKVARCQPQPTSSQGPLLKAPMAAGAGNADEVATPCPRKWRYHEWSALLWSWLHPLHPCLLLNQGPKGFCLRGPPECTPHPGQVGPGACRAAWAALRQKQVWAGTQRTGGQQAGLTAATGHMAQGQQGQDLHLHHPDRNPNCRQDISTGSLGQLWGSCSPHLGAQSLPLCSPPQVRVRTWGALPVGQAGWPDYTAIGKAEPVECSQGWVTRPKTPTPQPSHSTTLSA